DQAARFVRHELRSSRLSRGRWHRYPRLSRGEVRWGDQAIPFVPRYDLAMTNEVKRIGLISDTHGLLRKEAVEALLRSELIPQAGDVGRPEILEALKKDRKSTRLNSSHVAISYAVFCLKKK